MVIIFYLDNYVVVFIEGRENGFGDRGDNGSD